MFDLRSCLTAKSRKVTTHFQVDLDAMMSVALWALLIDVRVRDLMLKFVPASTPSVDSDSVPLDISCGLKGVETSCFEELLKELPAEDDRLALARLARHVTLQDQGGMFRQAPEVQIGSLGSLVAAMRVAGKSDAEFCQWAEDTLLAHLQLGRQRLAGERDLARATSLSGGKILLLPQGSSGGATGMAFESGAAFVIYQDGWNVGLLRSSTVTEPHLGELLGPELPPGYYLDPRGFMVAWGTRKAPARAPAPLSALQLAELLASKLS